MFKNSYFFLFLILAFTTHTFSQVTINDSLIIKHYKAINLNDSINPPLPIAIKDITVAYFKNHGLNPNDYYVIDPFPLHAQLIGDEWYINFMNLKALRIMYECQRMNFVFVGGYGIDMDDIQVKYDIDFKTVLGVYNSE